ncbi:hypothetical protein [Chitinophaga rhizophila]|uniref:RxLR effector protein n=1 Tax=Chitinophaga rhizophila TaxID=2866212 RepID=A0ABS7GA17_9BACT|nr:hypothetical protein [Chitinophaga rhizophila]MBW8683383.1 hypothetical protein [Chitinophaga rhizophila]
MRVSLSYLAPMALLAVACSAGSGHRATSDDVVTEATDSTTFSNDITALNSPSRKRVKTADV